MNKRKDKGLVRTNFVRTCLTDDELSLIRDYQQQTRAPSLSAALRKAALAESKHSQNIVKKWSEFQENKESNKENKEITPTHEKNAHTHARDLNFYVSWITDNASQRPLAEEFLRGRLTAGENLEQKGAAELKKHFGRWLPKYQAKMEIAARRNGVLQDQNLAKREREAMSAAQQRQLDAALLASQTPEAQAERDRVCAKFGKPWKRVADRSERSEDKKNTITNKNNQE